MPERWATVERLYHEALARAEDERAAFLEDECHGDEGLRLEVQASVWCLSRWTKTAVLPCGWHR